LLAQGVIQCFSPNSQRINTFLHLKFSIRVPSSDRLNQQVAKKSLVGNQFPVNAVYASG